MTYLPKLSGRNLEDRRVTLPDDLTSDTNLLCIGYQRWHQTLIDGWTVPAQQLMREYQQLAVYELPVFESVYRLFRSFIDGGMRLGIPSKAVRETTITIYTNIRAFNQALAIPDTETIAVLLVDLKGRVLWQTRGSFEPEKFSELHQVVHRYLSGAEVGS